MKIAIRKENNGSIYIDKTALTRFTEEELKQPPYNYSFVDVDCEDCIAEDFNNDLTFNKTKYENRKQNVLNSSRIAEIQTRLNELSQDFIQADLGADFGKITLEDDTVVNVIDLRKEEFRTLHNELRVLLNKEPRIYI